ncbi:guanylate kinase [Candidatus Uhrbacteria bacterium]|nr:guanylate kinase [Candidatus Uhrbacteria bacterium]
MSGHIIILSAPSRCGKDTVVNALNADPALSFRHITTYTTRPKRREEVAGVHHHFVSEPVFQSMIQEGKLLEWARVRGAYFGTPIEPVERALDAGENILLKIEVQGMKIVKQQFPHHVRTIFIKPQSIEDIRRRLRVPEFSPEQQRIRLAEARREIRESVAYDYVVTNVPNKLRQLIAEVRAIVAKILSESSLDPADAA